MHIEINDLSTVQDIQKTFSDFYPYLQLAFYRKPHKKYEASRKPDQVAPDKTIGRIRKTHISALLEIQPSYTIAQVENEFQQRFGLSVQVLMKEKDRWQQTTGMDDFTLHDANEFSRNASDEYILTDEEEEEPGEE